MSKTDQEQLWGKPSVRQLAKEKYSKGKFFYEMRNTQKLISKTPTSCSDMNSVLKLKKSSALKIMCSEMEKSESVRSVQYLLSELIQSVEVNVKLKDCQVCTENLLIFAKEYPVYTKTYSIEKNLQEFYMDKICLSTKEIIQLSCGTLDQSSSKDWFVARQQRISASKSAHRIKSRVKKSVESLVLEMIFEKKIDNNNTQYGVANERNARHEYETMYNVSVKQVGVIVCASQPWLCASLDGVVVRDYQIINIVEIKCPASCKNQPVINEDTQEFNIKYLEWFNGYVLLKKSHIYFTQCQIQLYVSGQSVCDLFIWSPISSCCVRVYRDEEFLKNVIYNCEEFYFLNYLPKLYDLMPKSDSSVKSSSNTNQKREFTGKNIINIT